MEMKSKFVDSRSGRQLYREFSRKDKADFVGHGPRFFTSLERSRLIFSLIEETIEKGGAGINIDKLCNEDQVSIFLFLFFQHQNVQFRGTCPSKQLLSLLTLI
jgi:hypothetical protein